MRLRRAITRNLRFLIWLLLVGITVLCFIQWGGIAALVAFLCFHLGQWESTFNALELSPAPEGD